MHTKQLVLTGLLVILSVPTILFAESKIRVKNISDFEGKLAMAGWEIPGRAKSDWAKASQVTLEKSSQWASEGSQSAKFVFDNYEKGEDSWRITKRWLPKDWRGWDTFEFDFYNPGSQKAEVRVQIYQGSKRLFDIRSFESGTWHVTIPIYEKGNHPDADLSQMTSMIVCMLEPKCETTVFMDNFQLVDRSSVRLEELVVRLRSATQFDSKRSGQYTELLKDVKQIESALSLTDAPGEREKRIFQIDVLREEVNDLMILSAKDTAERLADNLALVSPLSKSRMPLGVADTTEDRNKAESLESFVEVIQERLAQSQLTAAMSEHLPNADFTLGIPSAPITLTKQPMTYGGPLRQAVHIYAARREYEPFQLVILPKKHDLKDIQLIASDFTGPGKLSAENIEIAPMGWRTHPRDGKTHADMLRPDIKKFDVPKGVQQPVWVNVYVPENTVPGDYKGEIQITSANAKEQVVKVTLTVWPFTLPKYPSLSTGIHGWGRSGELVDVNAKFVIAHRLSPSSIYQSTPLIPVATFQKWYDWGGTDFNILRISRMGKGTFVANDAGELRISPAKRDFFIKKLDPWMEHAKKTNPNFLQHCYLYGFDELLGNMVPAMEAMYGELKERYGPIRTAAAFSLPLWEEYPDIQNLDIWIVLARLLTPQLRDSLHAQGRELWWYNLYTDNRDPVGCRVQFWSTFKDRLDGVLHFNLRRGGGENPYGPKLETPSDRAKDEYSWGGLVRRTPEGLPVSTIALEYWREGLEDCDYLFILRDLRNELAKQPNALEKHKYLIADADRMIAVPETITAGIIGGKQEEKGEITLGFSNHTKKMEDILAARRHVAELIMQLQKILRSDEK